MEAQPVLVLAARDGVFSEGSSALIIEHGGARFAVIITGMGTRNAEAKADAALVLSLQKYDHERPKGPIYLIPQGGTAAWGLRGAI
jgi:hypothetical protein